MANVNLGFAKTFNLTTDEERELRMSINRLLLVEPTTATKH